MTDDSKNYKLLAYRASVCGTRYTLRKYVSQVSSVIHRFEEMVDFSSTFPSEIAVISSGNHGNFLRKSRQLLEEITAIIARNHGNFLRKSRQLLEEILRKTDRKVLDFCNVS